VRSIGSTISFVTPGGEQVRVGDTFGGGVATNYWLLQGRASAQPLLSVAGADANINAALTSKGTGSISLNTNGGAQQQLNVAHTASAVNFVQVTGAATGGQPQISAQGSDANVILNIASKNNSPILFSTNGVEQFRAGQTASAVNTLVFSGGTSGLGPTVSSRGADTNVALNLSTKGTGATLFYSNNSANIQFSISGSAAAVNNLQVAGSIAGAAPVMSAQGSDTNIDLALTPKGTGLVRFGTYTASMALTVQGYVEIKDSGGTIRRLAVVA
jgi:hypothetical protein